MGHGRTVLISAAGTGTAFALASRLRASWGDEVRLITADINPAHLVTASVLSDAFFKVPPAKDDDFDATIAELIRRENVESYIPLLNAEIRQAHVLAASLDGVDVWASALAADLCADKARASEWLCSIGVPVPTIYSDVPPEGVDAFFVKPVDGFGSQNARQMSAAQLTALPADQRAGLVVQDICEPPEVTIDSFFDAGTGFARAVVRERLEVKAGVCTKARVYEDEELSHYARLIGAAAGQKGTFCFQAMRKAGGWAVTDLNFRPGAGTALTCATGVDVLSAAFACRWGEDYQRHVSARLPAGGLFVTRQYSEFVMSDE